VATEHHASAKATLHNQRQPAERLFPKRVRHGTHVLAEAIHGVRGHHGLRSDAVDQDGSGLVMEQYDVRELVRVARALRVLLKSCAVAEARAACG
jgi:hypothetical protein